MLDQLFDFTMDRMKTSAMYQVIFLGKRDTRADRIADLVSERLVELGLDTETLIFFCEANARLRDRRLPTIAVFLGYDGADDAQHPVIGSLVEDSITIITLVSCLTRVSREIPASLRHVNALEVELPDKNFDRATSLLLEGFRLLRRERRLFISYKRDDSRAVANQLYDLLDAHGFDVFIDTRSVPPSADFQAELWHRLSDSDVVVLLDTPGFRSSRWTTEELARANATNIQILHLLWPGQVEDPASAFSYFHPLEMSNFEGATPITSASSLTQASLAVVCRHVERLRARAIAARHRYLIDSFCDAARDTGLTPNVQPQRWISIELAPGRELAVVPAIGVPTSDRINEVFDAISDAGSGSAGTWVMYDNRGLLASWLKHLDWLDNHLPARAMGMAAANEALKDLAA